MHWRRKWQPTPVFLPGESQGWGNLVGAVYGVVQSQTRLKRLNSSSSSIGEGNDNPLQCSCLENPRDRRAWWAAVYGVVQSQTLLKPLSSSSSSSRGLHAKSLQSCPTPWTIAHQAPLSIEFSRSEYWSGLLCLPPGDLPGLGIEPTSLMSPALAGRFFTTSTTWEVLYSSPNNQYTTCHFCSNSPCYSDFFEGLGTLLHGSPWTELTFESLYFALNARAWQYVTD